MQATELLLHTFPSADTAFRFAVAGAFDVVAEEEGVLVSELRGDREVQGRLQRIIRGHSIGESVKLDVQRFGQTKTFSVKLGGVEAPPTAVAES